MSDFNIDGIDLAEIFGTSEGFEVVGMENTADETSAEGPAAEAEQPADEGNGSDEGFDMFGFLSDLGNAFASLAGELNGEGEDGEECTLEYGVDIEWPKLC
ncbi:MAG: hypothetical protein IJG63_03900 [Oscillospiraceae bacterium]|nr:hypothetical protein [Oscillospiraceae bacterium]